MIEKYHRFDIEKLLKDMPMHRAEIVSLQEQLKHLDGVGGMDNGERVGGTKPVDGVEQLVIRRMFLELQIESLRRDVELIDKLFYVLPLDEQAVIEEFFWKHQSKAMAVINLSERLHIEQSSIYDLRKNAINHMAMLICG